MPKIAHTMAIPPGFPAYRRRDMRAKKSSKNLLRISGLALVFMLAVALLVSAISFTRVGAGDNKTAFAAVTVEPPITELAIDASGWKWNVPFKKDADGNIAVFSYRPSTYTNYFAWLGGGYQGISGRNLTDTYASIEPGAAFNRRERLFAYYKLPDVLTTLGATIEVSANLDSAVKFTDMKNTHKFISVASNISKIEENKDEDKLTIEQIVEAKYNLGTSWQVTADRQYILVYAGGQEDGSEKIEISGLEITIKVKSVDNQSLFTPVTAAWDGKTKPDIAVLDTIANISNLYTTDNNIVGNLDLKLSGEDVLDPTFNKLTSIRTDGTQSKQFSFLLFDKFFGLKEADIQGFNLLQAYRGEGAITDGKAKTYKREDYSAKQLSDLRYPTGLQSITVQPFAFDNNDPATGSFRGLYVTVIYDGKDNGLLPIETDTIYRVNYKNSINLLGKTLNVNCDGIDYTPPEALNEVALLTENVVNGGVTYFYTDTIKFKPVLEDTDNRGDVKYFYTLYKIVDGNYVEIKGQTGIAINNPGFDVFTLSGLEKGEYAINFKAIDTVGQFYENHQNEASLNPVQQGWEKHTVYSDYHRFTIDDVNNPPEKWATAIYLENSGAYNGEWTNQNVVIEFNTLSSIMDITYEISYRTLKNGVVGTQTEWVSINDKIKDNKYIIGYDETSPEGYERIYYLRATYTSSNITYNVEVPVKYDNYNGYKPEIAELLKYTDGGAYGAYADLLPLKVQLTYRQVGKEGFVSEFLGSPMTLHYAITRDGVPGEAKELSLDTNDVYMDLFEGRNVSGLTQIQVRFWLEDEAGNKNDETTYNVNLDRAKINVNFNIDTNARRYFNNTTDVSTSLVSYTLSNKFTGTIPSGKIGITFDAAYDGVNAGIRQVIVSNVLASYVEGSAYTAALIDEYEKVFFDVNGNVITLVDGRFVVGTHEIRKARLTIDENYKHAPFVYNGTINYAMTDYVSGDGSLLVLDKVLGDKADEWKNIQWKGTFQLDSIDVNNGLRASLINIEIAGELNNNYQITNAGGSASAPKAYIDILPAKLGKITLIASKIYNGENTILTNSDNCEFRIEGLQGTDNITLEYGTIIILDKDGKKSKDVGTYTFNVTDFQLVGERQKFYDLTDVTVEATITVTPKPITVTVNNVDKPFDNKKEFQISSYSFGGVVTGDDVKLLTSTGNTANINVGTYPDCKVTLGITGNDSKNYVLNVTEAVVTVTISPREIGGAKITGIYAVDTNGNYYYINEIGAGEVVIYQKDGAGYIAYSKDENGKAKTENVDVLPAGATVWVLDTFVKGGVCVINGHRFELSQDIVYAIEYYEDTELKNKLDIGAIDFKERQYQPVVVDQNGNKFVINVNVKDGVYDTTSGAYKYTLKIESFGAKSNFQKITGFNDTETKVVSVLDFSDVKFENKMFNGEGYVDKFSAPYNAEAYTLNVISPSQLTIESEEYFKKGADGVWVPVENAIDAGEYYGKFTVSRLNNEYIIEQTFTIEKIGTEIKIKDASVTYDAKYGEDFAEKVQKVDDAFNYYKTTYGMVVGANDIVYEYSFDEDFKTILGSAPVRQGGGVCYVRVRYKGNENFIGSVSLARKINVNGAKFNLVDITANVGESFNLPTVENLIDKDSVGGNYKDIAKDFVIVYRVSDASYKVVNNAAELGGKGRYPYRVVHKGLIKGGAWTVDSSAESERYTRAVSADGIIEATISITENELNSVWGGNVNVPDDKVLEDNGIGTISGSWTQADSGCTVYFCILDRNNAKSRDNFTNGLRQNKEIFGKEYVAGKVYFLSLSEYKNKSVLMNADKQPRLMSPATVTMNVSANGAKLIRYNNGEWTEVNYVDNGDGTVTFETDKLGYFIFAEDYVAPKAKTNTLAIGIGAGVGGAAVLMAIIVVTLVVIKRKRA